MTFKSRRHLHNFSFDFNKIRVYYRTYLIHETLRKVYLTEIKIKLEKKNPWMTDDILQLIKEERLLKGTNRYKEMDREVKKNIRKVKNAWIDGKCEEV